MTGSYLPSRRTAFNISAGALLLFGGLFGVIPAASSQEAPPPSVEANHAEALVNNAAALIDSKGKAAFTEFGKPGSKWRNRDTYVFVADLKGTTLFHGAFPALQGDNRRSVKDSNGKLFVVEFENVVQSHGSGWVDYTFPKPGQSKPSQKWSYVKAVIIDGIPRYVGTGFYPQ